MGVELDSHRSRWLLTEQIPEQDAAWPTLPEVRPMRCALGLMLLQATLAGRWLTTAREAVSSAVDHAIVENQQHRMAIRSAATLPGVQTSSIISRHE